MAAFPISVGIQGPDEVRAFLKQVIDGVAQDGGYILDASAIVQNDARSKTSGP
jgi:hypothetical protein